MVDLKPEEYQMIIDGLEALKSKDFAGEMMGDLIEMMIMDKDKMSPEKKAKYEEEKATKEESKRLKAIEKEELKRKIDVLKTKMILAQDEAMTNTSLRWGLIWQRESPKHCNSFKHTSTA